MNRENLLQKTIGNLTKLPDQKLKEVADFAEFLLHKIEQQVLLKGIEHLTTESKAFEFLKEDEDLYTTDDLQEKFK